MKKHWNMVAPILIAVLIVVVALLANLQSSTPKPQTTPTITTQTTLQTAPQTEISYRGSDGKTALELLKENNYLAGTKTFSSGEFVTSIDGVVADTQHFWAFYVNGQLSPVGAGSYITKNDDLITWKLEEIK